MPCTICQQFPVPTSGFTELADNIDRHGTLYRCDSCGAFIELIAEERAARFPSEIEVRRYYPAAWEDRAGIFKIGSLYRIKKDIENSTGSFVAGEKLVFIQAVYSRYDSSYGYIFKNPKDGTLKTWFLHDDGQDKSNQYFEETCVCDTLDDCFYLESAPIGFEEGLTQLEVSVDWWQRLFECPMCSALWAIDEWDKYHDQVVTRVNSSCNWTKQLSEEKQKQLLLKSRGGVEGGNCIWAGRYNPRVKGVVYCLDHLYAAGARK